MARALAGEAKCSFFYKSASEFDEVFVGMGALRIRKLFEAATVLLRALHMILFTAELPKEVSKQSSRQYGTQFHILRQNGFSDQL